MRGHHGFANPYVTLPVQCSAATNHLITNAVLNITSDVMIILIPMPVFLAVKLPIKRKAILVGVFALGIFTVCISDCFAIIEYGLADPETDSFRHFEQVL